MRGIGLIRQGVDRVLGRSGLNRVIPPEVVDDGFAAVIEEIAGRDDVRTAIEIGSSNGAGSTTSLVRGLDGKPGVSAFCVEFSRPRFLELERRFADRDWVHCINRSSVGLDGFASELEVTAFYKAQPADAPLRRSSLGEILRWLRQDIDHTRRNMVDEETAIEIALRTAGVEHFDLALIDGSEFTGTSELARLYGATYVLLDDTVTYKNAANLARLKGDPAYELLAEDPTCRHGFAAFRLAAAPA